MHVAYGYVDFILRNAFRVQCLLEICVVFIHLLFHVARIISFGTQNLQMFRRLLHGCLNGFRRHIIENLSSQNRAVPVGRPGINGDLYLPAGKMREIRRIRNRRPGRAGEVSVHITAQVFLRVADVRHGAPVRGVNHQKPVLGKEFPVVFRQYRIDGNLRHALRPHFDCPQPGALKERQDKGKKQRHRQ